MDLGTSIVRSHGDLMKVCLVATDDGTELAALAPQARIVRDPQQPGQWLMAVVDPPALKAGTVPLVAGLSRQKRPLSTFELIQQLAALVY